MRNYRRSSTKVSAILALISRRNVKLIDRGTDDSSFIRRHRTTSTNAIQFETLSRITEGKRVSNDQRATQSKINWHRIWSTSPGFAYRSTIQNWNYRSILQIWMIWKMPSKSLSTKTLLDRSTMRFSFPHLASSCQNSIALITIVCFWSPLLTKVVQLSHW